MSNILKHHELASLEAFDFREIERTDVSFDQFSRDEEQASEEAELDPLQELENTIQKRLLEAERKAESLEREAYEKGYAQGQKDGIEYGRKSMEITKERLEELLSHLQGLPRKVLSDYRDWLLTTSLTIARRVVRKELSIRTEPFMALIASLLQEAQESQALTLHLNPKDLDLVEKHTELQGLFRQSERSLILKPDPGMERGGCRLENDLQQLDASLEAQFALMEEALFSQGAGVSDGTS